MTGDLRLTAALSGQAEKSTCLRRTSGRQTKFDRIIWVNLEDIGYGE
jgi:hypothetical protein